ncbi:MAG: EamA family transporter [Candidatus Saganbacteria bacterium]|nr:EamA family transporter [Candidatus Saganbacteria bacterium]
MKILFGIFTVGFLVAFGQVSLKIGSKLIQGTRISLPLFADLIKNPFILFGGFSFAAGFLLWIMILSKANLGTAYPVMMGTEFSLIVLFSYFLLKEPMNIGKIIGIMVIFIGIIIVSKNL